MAVELVNLPSLVCSDVKFAILRSSWGYLTFRAAGEILTGITLPVTAKKEVLLWVAANWPNSKRDDSLCPAIQKQVIDYYEGKKSNFHVRVGITCPSSLARNVLRFCAKIPPGKTLCYGELARKSGAFNAARAVGSILARNPCPLIIPCHRVIAANGRIGGFSAPGGSHLKRRLLMHEQKYFAAPPHEKTGFSLE